jgi:hypothetical protein
MEMEDNCYTIKIWYIIRKVQFAYKIKIINLLKNSNCLKKCKVNLDNGL